MSASPNSGLSTGQVTPIEFFPSTPRERFIPRRAMTSFENLVALANHQERLKEAKKMVWRDKGQPITEMETLRECFTHAMSGGVSEFYLPFKSSFISYFIFHVLTPRIRHSRVQYTRFSQCYTCPHSYSSYAKVGLQVAFKNDFIKSFKYQRSPSCRDTSRNFWLGYLEIRSYAW